MSLRSPRPSFDIAVPCSEKHSFRFLTSCQRCNGIDRVGIFFVIRLSLVHNASYVYLIFYQLICGSSYLPFTFYSKKFDSACKETGYHVQIACGDPSGFEEKIAENKNKDVGKKISAPIWTACDPDTFSDLNAERRNFVVFEVFIGACGVIAYVFVRRQHKRLDQRLVDRVNRQILAST